MRMCKHIHTCVCVNTYTHARISYYTQHSSDGLSYVFYGVITNAECAGYAFAAAFNRITVMAANYWCVDLSFCFVCAGYAGAATFNPITVILSNYCMCGRRIS